MNYLEDISLKKLMALIKTEIKNNKSSEHIYLATINTTWAGTEAPYTQSINIDEIAADDTPVIDLILSDDYTIAQTQLSEWAKIYKITTSDGVITVYATEATTLELTIQLRVVK